VEMVEIKFISHGLKLSPSIAIVGSSDLLIGTDFGKEIDSFSEVVRFNRAPTIGYEEDVGSKSTMRVTNNHVFEGVKLDSSDWPNQPPDFIRNLRDTRVCYFGPDLGPWNRRHERAHSSCELYRFKYEKMVHLKKSFDYHGKNFTVGVGFVCVCVASGLVPCLYGFDLENRYRGHYYEAPPPPSKCHDRNSEQILLKKMLDDGRIVVK